MVSEGTPEDTSIYGPNTAEPNPIFFGVQRRAHKKPQARLYLKILHKLHAMEYFAGVLVLYIAVGRAAPVPCDSLKVTGPAEVTTMHGTILIGLVAMGG